MPQRRRRTNQRTGCVLLVLLVLIAIGAIAQACSGGSASPAGSGPAQSSAASAGTVTYLIRGTASADSYAEFGPDLDILHHRVPMRLTQRLADASFYNLTAYLQTSGRVTCEILVNGRVIARGRASGSFVTCSLEISEDPFTGRWQYDGPAVGGRSHPGDFDFD